MIPSELLARRASRNKKRTPGCGATDNLGLKRDDATIRIVRIGDRADPSDHAAARDRPPPDAAESHRKRR